MILQLKNKMSPRKIGHYIYFGLIVVVIITLYAMSIYLYRNFYMAITQSDVIIILKKDMVAEMFDVNKFNEIISNLEKKTKIPPPINIKDPFR